MCLTIGSTCLNVAIFGMTTGVLVRNAKDSDCRHYLNLLLNG